MCHAGRDREHQTKWEMSNDMKTKYNFFICPQCQTPLSEIIHGRELEVVALEIEDLEVPCPES